MSRLKLSMPIMDVRSTQQGFKTPEYIIKGFLNANIPDHYGTLKMKDGSKKALRSIFTDNAIDSIRRQAKSKKIFVDTEHKTAVTVNVKDYLNQLGINKEDQEKLLQQIEIADLPYAKVHDVYKDTENPSRIIFDTRLNPSYREIDEKHQKYFDAVWDSVQNKFIDSISPDFVITDVKRVDDIDYINDVQLFGINYTGGGALPENNIFEVAMRATQEFNEERGGKMEEELERKRKEIEDRERQVREREAEIKKAEDARKSEELEREKKEHKSKMEQMEKELQELKKKQDTGSRAEVPAEDKYGKPPTQDDLSSLEYRKKVKDTLWENTKIKNPYPNKENLFGSPPRKTNPEGEMGFGELRELQIDYFDSIKKNMSPDAQGVLNDVSADIRIPRRSR